MPDIGPINLQQKAIIKKAKISYSQMGLNGTIKFSWHFLFPSKRPQFMTVKKRGPEFILDVRAKECPKQF